MKIIDEFTDLPVSRQRKQQLRLRRDNPEKHLEIQKRKNASEKTKARKREWWARNKHKYNKGAEVEKSANINVTCGSLDCPERKGGKCNGLERLEHPERFGVTPGAKYTPIAWPTRYCVDHGDELKETGIKLTYNPRTGRTKIISQYLRCTRGSFFLSKCKNRWLLEFNARGKLITDDQQREYLYY